MKSKTEITITGISLEQATAIKTAILGVARKAKVRVEEEDEDPEPLFPKEYDKLNTSISHLSNLFEDLPFANGAVDLQEAKLDCKDLRKASAKLQTLLSKFEEAIVGLEQRVATFKQKR